MTPHFTYGHTFPYMQASFTPNNANEHTAVNRVYPSVNPGSFMKSAKEMERIVKDASRLIEKMAADRNFSFELMNAAQASQNSKINSMIKSTGITHIPKVHFTPDGLILHFESAAQLQGCCGLTLNIRWNSMRYGY
ncbi:hypothetical protein F7731_13145 [Cytobacillus depressus]|uniref:Uncharacterized protein n=1 Tax=Cytobacillus depressus TaxID=1602942 RepID=A0A6L3V9M4_9BACI|nr:hypothetical protein [Cytobacillus depressus]KAB2334715.1 hypothetical protein F7731_13145 [Cytobacillus depressus]